MIYFITEVMNLFSWNVNERKNVFTGVSNQQPIDYIWKCSITMANREKIGYKPISLNWTYLYIISLHTFGFVSWKSGQINSKNSNYSLWDLNSTVGSLWPLLIKSCFKSQLILLTSNNILQTSIKMLHAIGFFQYALFTTVYDNFM